MPYETLQYEKNKEVGRLTINRPKALNALNDLVLKELAQFISEIKEDTEVRALVVTGAGEKAFVAGADIKEMSQRDPSTAKAMAKEGQRVFQMIEDLPFVSIACVNGFALGGGLELAMACDFIIAAKGAKMGLPEVSLGLIPGYGGTQRLSRFIGKAQARMVALTGDMYPAEQMETWGLVAMTVEPSELANVCDKVAKKIASQSPVAVSLAKRAINEGYDRPQLDGLRIEADYFQKAFEAEDAKIGIQAFLDKSSPQFPGR